jgi:hypothetical protein
MLSMNSQWLSILVVIGLITVGAGCATTAPEPPLAESAMMMPPPTQIPPELNIVAFLDPNVADMVAVAKTDYRRTDSNTLEVVASFKNLSGCAMTLQARALYFSHDRVPQEKAQAWQPIYLPANGMGFFTARSLQADSEYFYVEVMPL